MCDNEEMASFWSNRNLSGTRDAVLIHGLAMLAGCVFLVLAVILRPDDQAFGPGLGTALSATGVFLVWSLTLAAPEEPKMLETVRAAARKWLDEHK
ncbi:MAG: hypothetical protein ABSE73_07575 [Planctomycetota bacterium]